MQKLEVSSNKEFENLYKEAFNVFFEGLHRYALTIIKDSDKASDVVQTVFVKWWESQKDFDKVESTKAYLYTAVYHQSLNALRNEKVQLAHKSNYKYEMEASSITQNDNLVFEQLDQQIKTAIDELPPQCRTIFMKSRFESKRYSEIADEMNLSVKTIEVQMSKALRVLREKIKNYTDSLSQ